MNARTKALCEDVAHHYEKLESTIRYLELPTACPFFFAFDNHIVCPFLDKDNSCRSIKIAPGNSASWCYKTIERGIKKDIKRKGCDFEEDKGRFNPMIGK